MCVSTLQRNARVSGRIVRALHMKNPRSETSKQQEAGECELNLLSPMTPNQDATIIN
jgi:hypothetical protein